MNNVALGICYNGASYHGWQFQNDILPTVQAKLEIALSQIATENIRVSCAGRTDAGVHATQQVVNFQTTVKRPSKAWVMGTNAHLPDDISVVWSQEVDQKFNARFSATSRRYVYLIHNNRIRSALFSDAITREYRPLDVPNMHLCAQALVGEHDFTSFRGARCQSNTPMRNVHHILVREVGDIIVIDIQANAFLLHMVRNIAGVLLDVGAGVKPTAWVHELLNARDRCQASATAPSNGLYLVGVEYSGYIALPQKPNFPHFLSAIA